MPARSTKPCRFTTNAIQTNPMLVYPLSESTFRSLYNAFGRLVSLMAVVSGAIIFSIMVIVATNVFLRRFFNAPLEGTLEVTELLMPFAIMLPMAYAQLQLSHIRVTILSSRLPLSLGRNLYAFALCAACIFFGWATLASGEYALKSWEINERVYGATIILPLYAAKFAVSAGLLLLSVQFLFDTVRVGVYGIFDTRDDMAHDQIMDGDTNG